MIGATYDFGKAILSSKEVYDDFINSVNDSTNNLDTDRLSEFSDTTSEMQDKINEQSKRLGGVKKQVEEFEEFAGAEVNSN